MKYAIIGLMALALMGCQFLPKNTVQLVNEVKNGTVLIENTIDVSNNSASFFLDRRELSLAIFFKHSKYILVLLLKFCSIIFS